MKSINRFVFSACLPDEYLADRNVVKDYKHGHRDVLHSKGHYILITRLILLAGPVCLCSRHLLYNTTLEVGWYKWAGRAKHTYLS